MGQRYFHSENGECEHLRTEGIYWIMRFRGSPHEHRLGPSDRQKLTQVLTVGLGAGVGATAAVPSGAQTQSPAQSGASSATSAPTRPSWMPVQPEPTTPSAVSPSAPRPPAVPQSPSPPPTDPESRRLRQAFGSLRTGLSPVTAALRPLAVGADVIERHADDFFKRIDDGGASIVFRGGYGLGKTFNLKLLRELALEKNFCVMLTEIDSSQNQLQQPNSVIRSLMKSLRFPDCEEVGVHELVRRVHAHLKQRFKHEQIQTVIPNQWPSGLAHDQRKYLTNELECLPPAVGAVIRAFSPRKTTGIACI